MHRMQPARLQSVRCWELTTQSSNARFRALADCHTGWSGLVSLTAPALAAYPGVHWIVGGISKTPDLDACLPYLSNVRFAYTIGQDGEMLGTWLSEHGVTVIAAGSIERALEKTAEFVRSGETVLLSPACASQDQFRDFEERGDRFRASVLTKGALA
jgi:UDP-N-acetylmuramoylalanine--D-glutamate ligase